MLAAGDDGKQPRPWSRGGRQTGLRRAVLWRRAPPPRQPHARTTRRQTGYPLENRLTLCSLGLVAPPSAGRRPRGLRPSLPHPVAVFRQVLDARNRGYLAGHHGPVHRRRVPPGRQLPAELRRYAGDPPVVRVKHRGAPTDDRRSPRKRPGNTVTARAALPGAHLLPRPRSRAGDHPVHDRGARREDRALARRPWTRPTRRPPPTRSPPRPTRPRPPPPLPSCSASGGFGGARPRWPRPRQCSPPSSASR